MKTEKKILIAFILNLSFAILEFFGGFFTNSVAIFSDAIHDLGDAITIGISYYLEKISKKKPDKNHTFGYTRYSVLGAAFTSVVLIIGAGIAVFQAVNRLFNPTEIHVNGMLSFAVVGVIINFIAAYVTHGGFSLNQKAVNLHMLEDVLGWIIVLIGAIVIKFTQWYIIDPVMSICLAFYIAYHACKNMKEIILIFAETVEDRFLVQDVEKWLHYVEGVIDVHHVHIWRLDETKMCASVHVKTTAPSLAAKKQIRHVFKQRGIEHVTIEFEEPNELCSEIQCQLYNQKATIDTCCHGHHHKHDHVKSKISNLDIEV